MTTRPDPLDPEMIDAITLDRRRIGVTFPISVTMLDAYPDFVIRDIRKRLVAFEADLLADKIAEAVQEHEVTLWWAFPTSPWQFFKQRHADAWWLRWLVKRRPVLTDRQSKTTTVMHVDRWRMFPRANIVLPPHLGAPVIRDDVSWRMP